MTGNELRERFLKYFETRGHVRVRSSSLVPGDDPTLLFTNAGMVQFKSVFLGEERRDYARATTCQKCVRAGGKHNDLENVGRTTRHHTFFEMLGNFSFGDYFKADAVAFAWEFLTRDLGLDGRRLKATVFTDDDDAFGLWRKVAGLADDRILRLGEEDNFWAMGDTGPCGPCSEIHFHQGDHLPCAEAAAGRPCLGPAGECDRWLEIWNLVFMQWNRDASGAMTPLPRPSIDTGMGLERMAAVLQGKMSDYDTDLFAPLIERVSALARKPYRAREQDDVSMQVIADHARTTAFLIADGVTPSNEWRGYVLRRIMRRAMRHGRLLGLTEPFLWRTVPWVAELMREAYPELATEQGRIEAAVRDEEERFAETLDTGMQLIEEYDEARRRRAARGVTSPPVLDGSFLFKLYDTLGLYGNVFGLILFHTAFGLPFAIFLLRNFFITLPKDLIEAARMDGASNFAVFRRIVIPLSVPALASFGIFQFLWVWNDLLMALVLVPDPSRQPMTVQITTLESTYGVEFHLLSAAAFLLMIVPLIVFFALQRYFVQGLLAGSVKT